MGTRWHVITRDCKPAIRSTAGIGSVLLGFAADSLYADNRLIYVAKVTNRLEQGRYFTLARYANRPDRIYRKVNGTFEWRNGAKYHTPRDLIHDLGRPPNFRRANALISDGAANFRYFGGKCPIDFRNAFSHVKEPMENLGQGHRVNLSEELQAELNEFIKQVYGCRSAYRQTRAPEGHCDDHCTWDDHIFRRIIC